MPCVRMQPDSNSGSTRQMWSASRADASVLRWTRLHRIFIRVHLWMMSPVACALSVWSRWRPPCCVTGEVFSSPQRGGRAFIDFINWVIFFIYCRNFDKMLCNTFNGCLTRDVCNWDVLTFADKHTRWWCHRGATTLRRKLDGGTDKEDVELLFLVSSLENKVMFTFWDGEKSFF